MTVPSDVVKKTAAGIADYCRLEFFIRRRGDYQKLRLDEEKSIREMERRIDRGIARRIETMLRKLEK